LRAYVSPLGKDWSGKLHLAEFAYNNAYHTAIGCSPFFLNFGENPRTPLTVKVKESRTPSAKRHFTLIMENVKQAQKAMERAQQRMKAQYDKHHKEGELKEGQLVLLATTNLKLKGCPKFLPKFVGPFKILQAVSTHAYKLELPTTWFIHPVFHVSLLKPYVADGTFQPAELPRLLQDDSYTIDGIYEHKIQRSGKGYKYMFLCGYNDCEPASRTWHSESELKKVVPMLLESYKRLHIKGTANAMKAIL
jgi:hypothetical protein